MPALFTRMSMGPNSAIRLGEHRLDLGFLRDVGLGGNGLSAGLLDLLNHFLRILFDHVSHHDLRAFLGELQRNAAPDSPSRSGDDGNFILESHKFLSLPLSASGFCALRCFAFAYSFAFRSNRPVL